MDLFLNDLSVAGGFQTTDQAVGSLLKLFAFAQSKRHRVLIARSVLGRMATKEHTLHQAIVFSAPAQRALLLNWLGRSGPFSDDEHGSFQDDLWWHNLDEVTEQGLGAAGRTTRIGGLTTSFSFSEGSFNAFDVSPLTVVQGFPDAALWSGDIPNFWSIEAATVAADAEPSDPESWRDFVSACEERFGGLYIDAENFLDALSKHPFSGNVVRRGFVLMEILDKISKGRMADGGLSPEAMMLVTEHFQGQKSIFSDEEPDDKNVFMFKDGSANKTRLYCSWHGKVKTPQFRLHFQWPVPQGQEKLKVLYFGEKLTKW